jgi:nickel-type superoxide dismutase maturation protease
MSPLLQPGDEVLVDLFAYRRSPPAVGDIVVAWHPTRKDFKLIKRVVEITIDHHYVLQGDNLAESTDSRTFGAVPPTLIIGKVVCRF